LVGGVSTGVEGDIVKLLKVTFVEEAETSVKREGGGGKFGNVFRRIERAEEEGFENVRKFPEREGGAFMYRGKVKGG
jgi:hypothetical protein